MFTKEIRVAVFLDRRKYISAYSQRTSMNLRLEEVFDQLELTCRCQGITDYNNENDRDRKYD